MKRHKCPRDYTLIGRSASLNNKTARRGVAVYVKSVLNITFRVYTDVCPDAVIFEIMNANVIIIAPYIVPENSVYKAYEIFTVLYFIIKNIKTKCIYIMGDLNFRCATPDSNPNYHYACNPDTVINTHGRKLQKLCK